MGCHKAELLVLLEYIERECKDFNSCKKVLEELKERAKKLAMVEAVNDLF